MKIRSISTAAIACGLLSGCASPLLDYSTDVPALQLRVVGQPGVEDGRARFREMFCTLLSTASSDQADVDCDRYLVRLADEPPAPRPAQPLPRHDPHLRILFVPGAFGECFADIAPPYPEAVARLSQLGYMFDALPVSGRSGTTHNATLIAQALVAEPNLDDHRLVLVGYSKGISDILEFLVDFPDTAKRVDAVVSIAGTVNGSPVADAYAGAYGMVSGIDLAACDSGDRGVVDSLRVGPRMNWLAHHRLPADIRYFSLAAIARQEDIGRLMYVTKKRLARSEPLHDGQVPFFHQIVPGSTLLGYAYGDHWAVALPLQEKWPYWAGNSAGSQFPRAELLEAIVLYLVEALGPEAGREIRRSGLNALSDHVAR